MQAMVYTQQIVRNYAMTEGQLRIVSCPDVDTEGQQAKQLQCEGVWFAGRSLCRCCNCYPQSSACVL